MSEAIFKEPDHLIAMNEDEIVGNVPKYAGSTTTAKETDNQGKEFAQNEYSESSLTRSERVEIIRDLFHERCSLLYHDIIDTITHGDHIDSSGSEASSPRLPREDLWFRHRKLMDEAEVLVDRVPEMQEDVGFRMQLVKKGMTQLDTAITKLSHEHSSGSSGEEHGSNGSLSQLRRWLQTTEERLSCVGWQNFSHTSLADLHKMHSEQQILQREIERDGGALVSAVQKQLKVGSEDILFRDNSDNWSSRVSNRRRVVISSLQRRWHSLWLKSLEWQCKFEQQIKLFELDLVQAEDSDSDSNEPSAKRRRLGQAAAGVKSILSQQELDTRSEASDTIPFCASEYESIMESCQRSDKNAACSSSYANSDSELTNNSNLSSEINGNGMGSVTDSDVEYRNSKGQVVYNRGAMVGDNEGVRTLKEEGDWVPGRVEIVHQDVGYSSGENSLQEGITDEQLVRVYEPQNLAGRLALKRIRGGAVIPRSPSDQLNNNVEEIDTPPLLIDNDQEPIEDNKDQEPIEDNNNTEESRGWNSLEEECGVNVEELKLDLLSNPSSPNCERKKRIESSPIKSYYKVTPLDDEGVTDTDTPRQNPAAPTDSLLMVFGQSQEEGFSDGGRMNESSLIVQVDSEVSGQKDLQDVLSLLDDSFERDPMTDSFFGEQLDKIGTVGTTWKPFVGRKKGSPQKEKTKETNNEENQSCDASGEQSEGEEDKLSIRIASPPELLVSPPPPNSPQENGSFPQFTSTPTHSLKRQRRRRPRSERPLSLTSGIRTWKVPNSHSENAIMNLSMCSSMMSSTMDGLMYGGVADSSRQGGVMSQSLNSTLQRQHGERRKKLRARRMPRSMSDGEQLSLFALMNRSGTNQLPCTEPVDPPPPSPTELDHGVYLNDRLSQFNANNTPTDYALPDVETSTLRVLGGNKEGWVFEEMGGGEGLTERMEGDGGSLTEAGEQSENNVWEWDDYKPPNHSELGFPDQKLDDSDLTAFGDDYRLYLGALDGNQSGLSSARSQPMSGVRVPPIGLSANESDSEAEDLCHVIRESQKQLRMAQSALRRGGDKEGRNGHSGAELKATCETNVRCLQAITGHLLSLGTKSTYSQHDYNSVTGLLKDWQDLLYSVRNSGQIESAGNSNNVSDGVLHGEISRLAHGLQELINLGSLNTSFTTGCYKSTHDIQDAMELLQDIHSRLQEEQKRLRILASSFQTLSGSDGEIKIELQQLCSISQRALESCAHQLSELGHLRESWNDWEKTRDTVSGLMETLDKKLTQLEWFREHSGTVAASGGVEMPSVKAVYSELQVCQERLNRLETVCNFLVSSSCDLSESLVNGENSIDGKSSSGVLSTSSQFDEELKSLTQSLGELNGRFRQLPESEKFLGEICECHEEEKGAERLRENRKARRRQKGRRGISEAEERGQRLRSKGIARTLWGCVKSSWPVQLCLLVLVCLGAVLITPLCSEQQRNNWAWAWGPQLNYVRGPPPS